MTPNDLADALSNEATAVNKWAQVLRALDYDVPSGELAEILRDSVATELDRLTVRLIRMFDMALPDDPIAEPSESGNVVLPAGVTALAYEGLEYFDRVGDDGDKEYVAAIRELIRRLAQPQRQDYDAAVGRAFLSVLRDPDVAWRDTGAKGFIDRVAETAGEDIANPQPSFRTPQPDWDGTCDACGHPWAHDCKYQLQRQGPVLVDSTVARHVADKAHGTRYGVDWAYHDDTRGLLSEREAFPEPQRQGRAVAEQANEYGEPEVIYLQLHGDGLRNETKPDDYKNGDVTWCWHRIYGQDVKYIRADIYTKQPASAAVGDRKDDRQRAQSILADEYRRAGFFGAADDACSDTPSPHCEVTISAIVKALAAAPDRSEVP